MDGPATHPHIRDSAGGLTGHDLAVVPAQEPVQLAPQPPPPVLVPPACLSCSSGRHA